MSELRIYGASDDLVEFDGAIEDEFSALGGHGSWTGELVALDGHGLRVHIAYGPDGMWSAGVSQLDEDKPLPDWPLALRQGGQHRHEPSYSTVLVLDVPDGTALLRHSGEDDSD